ncbi:MAG: hypothetical protein R2856_35285 [Caldilineaceae bacterium]
MATVLLKVRNCLRESLFCSLIFFSLFDDDDPNMGFGTTLDREYPGQWMHHMQQSESKSRFAEYPPVSGAILRRIDSGTRCSALETRQADSVERGVHGLFSAILS